MNETKDKINAAKKDDFISTYEIYNDAIKKLAEVITLTCKEQGIALSNIWNECDRLIKRKISLLEIKTKDKEENIKQLSFNLINEFQNKFKQYEFQLNNIKANLEETVANNLKLKTKIEDYECDQKVLLEKCSILKGENRNLKNHIRELEEKAQYLKIILFQSDGNSSISYLTHIDVNPENAREKLMKLKMKTRSCTLLKYFSTETRTRRRIYST